MLNVASFIHTSFSNFIVNRNREFLHQVLQSFNVSMVGHLVFLDLFLDISLSVGDARLKFLEIVVDRGGLLSNSFLHVLNKTGPFISSIAALDVRGKEEDITSLFEKTKTAHHNFELVVEDTSLMVLKLNLWIHNHFVGLRDNSNQEVKQNNENENLI